MVHGVVRVFSSRSLQKAKPKATYLFTARKLCFPMLCRFVTQFPKGSIWDYLEFNFQISMCETSHSIAISLVEIEALDIPLPVLSSSFWPEVNLLLSASWINSSLSAVTE